MCCLFGLVDYKHILSGPQKSRILSVLSRECEARGTDASGVAYNSGGKLRIYKRPLPARKLHLNIPSDAYVVMGHTRMTTQGSERRNYNNHPFPGTAGNLDFALAHNGVIYNDGSLRKSLKLPSTHIQTDSFIAVQLIEQQKALSLQSLQYMAQQVEGSFVFTALDSKNTLYFVKGDNPMCIYRYPKHGLLIYASTEEILRKALGKMKLPLEKPTKLELQCGDLLQINSNGTLVEGNFDSSHLLHSWYLSGCAYHKPFQVHGSEEDPYLEDIKSLAGYFGYSPEEMDLLIQEGFTVEELEEYLYCGVM